jgi:hypothetical protein
MERIKIKIESVCVKGKYTHFIDFFKIKKIQTIYFFAFPPFSGFLIKKYIFILFIFAVFYGFLLPFLYF